jgi:hypothetical protein
MFFLIQIQASFVFAIENSIASVTVSAFVLAMMTSTLGIA